VNTTPTGKVMVSVVSGGEEEFQGVLCIDFLIEKRTANATYFKLLKDSVKPAFRSKR
jgi:hypothetical protein